MSNYKLAFIALILSITMPTKINANSCKAETQALQETTAKQFEDVIEVSDTDYSASVRLERNINCSRGLFGIGKAYGYNAISGTLIKPSGAQVYTIIFLFISSGDKDIYDKARYKIGDKEITSNIVFQGAMPKPYNGKLYSIELTESDMKLIVDYYSYKKENQIVPIFLPSNDQNSGIASLGFANEIIAVYNKLQSLKSIMHNK